MDVLYSLNRLLSAVSNTNKAVVYDKEEFKKTVCDLIENNYYMLDRYDP